MSNPSNTPDPTASRAILARRIVKQKEVVANFAAQISNIEADAEANQTRREKRGMFSRFFSLLDPSGGMSVLATIGLRQEQEKEEEKLEALEEEYAALEAAARLQQARLERDIRELAPPPIQSPTEPPPNLSSLLFQSKLLSRRRPSIHLKAIEIRNSPTFANALT